MAKYKKTSLPDGTEDTSIIIRTTDSTSIPTDPANKDYQEYLEWVAEGNTPEPADEV
jgi:hypothetical protein